MLHLFLSPHFDDAVYSCGGMIAQLTQAGALVRVYTVMGGSLPAVLPATPIVRELHARWQAGNDPISARRAEDQTALHLLDAEAAYNSQLPDCIYRVNGEGVPLYPDGAALFGAVAPLDPAVIQLELRLPSASQLWRKIAFRDDGSAEFIPNADVTLYAPLAAGQHVDHQIVRDWARKVHYTYPTVRLRFYEDFPYNRNSATVANALAQLPPLTVENVNLTEAAVEAKIQAMLAYRTQFSTFWQDEAALRADLAQTFRTNSGYAERIYHL
jgi:LmbE family N-acetylglucosaminyl deacetylase